MPVSSLKNGCIHSDLPSMGYQSSIGRISSDQNSSFHDKNSAHRVIMGECCAHSSAIIFDWIFFILAGNDLG